MRSVSLAEVNLRSNPNFNPGIKPPPLIAVNYGLLVLRDVTAGPLARQVQLTCTLTPHVEGTQPTYGGQVTVLADMAFDPAGELSGEEMDQRAAWYAINILIGANRSYVQVITGVSAFGPLLLGPVESNRVVQVAKVVAGADQTPVPLYPDQVAPDAPRAIEQTSEKAAESRRKSKGQGAPGQKAKPSRSRK